MARSLSFLSEVIVYDPPFEAVLSTEEECEVFPVRSIRLRVLSDRSPRTPVFKIVSPPFSFFFPPLTFSFSLCESLHREIPRNRYSYIFRGIV